MQGTPCHGHGVLCISPESVGTNFSFTKKVGAFMESI